MTSLLAVAPKSHSAIPASSWAAATEVIINRETTKAGRLISFCPRRGILNHGYVFRQSLVALQQRQQSSRPESSPAIIRIRAKTNVFRLRSGEVVIEIDEHYLVNHAAQSERMSVLLPTKPHPTSASRLHGFGAREK